VRRHQNPFMGQRVKTAVGMFTQVQHGYHSKESS
jgi:hypothetical protein